MRTRHAVKASSLALIGLASASKGTDFLDNKKLLAGLEDPQWFLDNVPILDVPQDQIQEIYYFRWTSLREHLYYTGAQFGYLTTGFLEPVDYAGPYGGTVGSAGHHIVEGRWLKDQRYIKDVINFWIAGPGQWPKPATDMFNADTYDWAHEYSWWAATSIWRHYLVTGDASFITGHLDNMVTQYRNYDNHFNETLGLYWQAPVWDATEYTVASYRTNPKEPYHGGAGYRPTINSYQYGDAEVISNVARMARDCDTLKDYTKRAKSLKKNTLDKLWDNKKKFFKHMARDNNPSMSLVPDREIMGFLPWMFDMLDDNTYSASFAQLTDPYGFKTPFGPPTAENRSEYFMFEAYDGCCRWDGPSWPYSTAQTLTAAEHLLNNLPKQHHFKNDDYVDMLITYAKTQYRDGVPYVAEAHDPYKDNWMYDSYNHSEDYNHSTFVDNVIAGLIGLRPQADNSLVINPLAPSSWEYFALENIAYHGHMITVLWDEDGSHYGQGAGFNVWVDGQRQSHTKHLKKATVQVGEPVPQDVGTKVNIASNPLNYTQGSQASASFSANNGGGNVFHAIDGMVFRVGIPENTRWTTYGSPHTEDWVAVDMRQEQTISDVRIYFYDDNGGVRVPQKYDLQYHDADSDKWVTIPDQKRDNDGVPNARITITFPEVRSSQIRVVANNPSKTVGWGVSEIEVWAPPIYQIRNVQSSKFLGVHDSSKDDMANVEQDKDSSDDDHLWELVAMPGGYLQIRNCHSDMVLAVKGMSKDSGAQLQQVEDDGGDDTLWRIQDKGKGQFLIINKNSGHVAAVASASNDDGASVVQAYDNGSTSQFWELLPHAGPGQ